MYNINGHMLQLPKFPYNSVVRMENKRFKMREDQYKAENISENIELNIVMNLSKNGVF